MKAKKLTAVLLAAALFSLSATALAEEEPQALENSSAVMAVSEIDWDAAEITLSSVEELQAFAEQVNGGKSFSKKIIKLGADINLQDVAWTPIGTQEKPFVGTFDGAGWVISNLAINKPDENNIGLFGRVANGSAIQNVIIENVTLTGATSVGAVVGQIISSVSNCTVRGNIQITGGHYTGGIAGYAYGSFTNCSVTGKEGSKISCVSRGYFNDNDGDKVGGIVGYVGEGTYTIADCAVSDIAIDGARGVGGIIGGVAIQKTTIRNNTVSNTGLEINGGQTLSAKMIGGIVGRITPAGGYISENCTLENNHIVETTITGSNKSYTGAIFGGVDGNDANVLNEVIKQNNTASKSTMDGAPLETLIARVNGQSYSSLEAALAAANGQTVELLSDITLTKSLNIPASADATLDLAGKTITTDHTNEYEINVYGKLRLIDSNTEAPGKITCIPGSKRNRGTISVCDAGEFVMDGGYITGDQTGVVAYDQAKITINEGKIDAEAYAITGNGTDITQQTTITINGGEIVTPDNTAIYHPQPGTLNIHGGLIQSAAGIEMRTGTLNIDGGKIVGLNPKLLTRNSNGGNTVFGPALVISKHVTDAPLAIHITGGEFDGLYAVYEENHMAGTPQPPVTNTTIDIQGGTFKTSNGGTEAVYSQNITNFICGGTFSTAIAAEYCAEGFSSQDNGDGTFVVVPAETKISASMVDAIAPAEGTGTLRFITKVDALTGTATAFGTYILPLRLFDNWDTDLKAVVKYEGTDIAAGDTFAADLTGIPQEYFTDEIMAQSFIIAGDETKTCSFNKTTVNTAAN